jgi:flagellar export protein FliJ
MKKFKFKYEAVEKVRKNREQEMLRALVRAQESLKSEKKTKEKLMKELDKSLTRREELGVVPVGPHAFQIEDDYIVGTKQRALKIDQAIFRTSKAVEKAMKNYLLSKRQSRTMEVLKEKSSAEYKDIKRKNEQKELDNFYIMRFRFREKGGA